VALFKVTIHCYLSTTIKYANYKIAACFALIIIKTINTKLSKSIMLGDTIADKVTNKVNNSSVSNIANERI